MTAPDDTEARWWYAHGGVLPTGEFCLMVIGETTVPPERAPLWLDVGDTGVPLARIATWDHEPSEEEKDALTPERFRDEGATGE